MIDFHCHVLPRMDDGSKSTEESLRMLKCSAEQGITTVAATPHFYADRDTPERFFSRRAAAMERLMGGWHPGLPNVLCGAEVHYFPGLQRTEDILRMRLAGTPLLLIEMPFSKWSGRMISDILELNQLPGVTVVLAHVERYQKDQSAETWEELRGNGVLMQSNAEFFLHWMQKRRALRMLERGEIQLLGSDSHNMDARAPRLGEALGVIRSGLGEDMVQALERNGRLAMGESGAALR